MILAKNPDWSMKQVVFCDLTKPANASYVRNLFQKLPSVVGVRQILSRAPGKESGSILLDNIATPIVLQNLKTLSRLGYSFDLQLIPEVMKSSILAL